MKKLLLFAIVLFSVFLHINCAHKELTEEERIIYNKKAEDLYNSGLNYKKEKRYWKARRKFNKVIDNYVDSDFADRSAFEVAEIFNEAKSYWRAYEKYQRVADDFPSTRLMPQVSEKQIGIGNYYWDKDKKYEAVEIYKKALENDRFGELAADIQYRLAGYYFEYAKNYKGLFRSIYKEDNFEESILEYKSALANYPNHPLSILAKYHLALAYYYTSRPWYNDQENTEEAISLFQDLWTENGSEVYIDDAKEKMTQLFDKKAESEYNIGSFYLRQNLLKSSRIYYQSVIGNDYSKIWNGKAYFGLGESYFKEKKWGEAKDNYDKSVFESPEAVNKKMLQKRLIKIEKELNASNEQK
ncbi:MAG: outer membrane protein assembly factor BamD [bacterium]|nr:outer membrane protein assembly factor BamD [bacterium]